jgi:PKD repeat protein
LAVAFNATASSDSDGSIASYSWSFGDGTTGAGVTTSHTYTAAGTYTARLTVTDNQGATGTLSSTITVSGANQTPAASFTATPTTGTAPLVVSFNGASSSDPDGSISSYAWSFGDGTTGSGATISHTYNTAGTYTATLTVTDNRGATNSTSKTISASAATASCRVSYSITNDWGNGFQAAVTLVNTGAAINGWTLTWTFAGNQKIYDLWNGRVSQRGQAVSVRNATYNARLSTGSSVPIGFNATYSGTNAKPTAFALNGRVCQVQ